eukprot:403352959
MKILEDNKLTILQNNSWADQYQQKYKQLKKQKEYKEDQYFKANQQFEELQIMSQNKLNEFTEEHSFSITAIDTPCSLLMDFGKCLLSMLHYRVLSWPQFKLVIKRYQILINELKHYSTDLIDADISSQLHEFKDKYKLITQTKNFESLNQETGNLLIWMYLKQSSKELHESILDLEFSFTQLNREKNKQYELLQQAKETVKQKIKQNEQLYEVIRQLEEQIMIIQQQILRFKNESSSNNTLQQNQHQDSTQDKSSDLKQISKRCETALSYCKQTIRQINRENRVPDKSIFGLNITGNLNQSKKGILAPDDSHILSRSMQADLKTLNLKKTFSFLQNLDYNDEDQNANNLMQQVIEEPKRNPKDNAHHNFGERLGGMFNQEEDIFDLNDKSNLVILRESQIRNDPLYNDRNFNDEHKTQRVQDNSSMMSSLNNIKIFMNDGIMTKKQSESQVNKRDKSDIKIKQQHQSDTTKGGSSKALKKQTPGCFGSRNNQQHLIQNSTQNSEKENKKKKKSSGGCCFHLSQWAFHISMRELVSPAIPNTGSSNSYINHFLVNPTTCSPIIKSARYLTSIKLYLTFIRLCLMNFSRYTFSQEFQVSYELLLLSLNLFNCVESLSSFNKRDNSTSEDCIMFRIVFINQLYFDRLCSVELVSSQMAGQVC